MQSPKPSKKADSQKIPALSGKNMIRPSNAKRDTLALHIRRTLQNAHSAASSITPAAIKALVIQQLTLIATSKKSKDTDRLKALQLLGELREVQAFGAKTADPLAIQQDSTTAAEQLLEELRAAQKLSATDIKPKEIKHLDDVVGGDAGENGQDGEGTEGHEGVSGDAHGTHIHATPLEQSFDFDTPIVNSPLMRIDHAENREKVIKALKNRLSTRDIVSKNS
jgi:hypothetical protein